MRILLFYLATTLLMLILAAFAHGDPGASPPAWSPYLAGAGIGVLCWFTFRISGKPLGASSAYASVAGLLGMQIAPNKTESLPYYQDNPPKVDWELMLVGAVILGAFVAALSGGEITGRWLPPMWVERFGDAVWLRLLVAFLGGALMAFGARLAGGCTSGHGISGALQLSVSSWLALICFFIGGSITAHLMFRL